MQSDIYDVVVTGAIDLESVDDDPIRLGGAGILAATAAAKYANTKLIGCIGNDISPEIVENVLDKTGADCSGIEIVPGKTFRWFVKYSQDKNSMMEERHDYGDYYNMFPNPNAFQAKVLLLATGHPKLHDIVLKSGNIGCYPKFIMMDTKGVHIKERFDLISKILEKIHVFFITEDEIKLFFSIINDFHPQKIFDNFNRLNMLVIKNHDKGGRILLRDGTAFYYRPKVPVKVIDPSGAGDVFAGAFAGLVSIQTTIRHEKLVDIIRMAATDAVVSVTARGDNKLNGLKSALPPNSQIQILVTRWN